jgi:hypothetical protein
MKFYYSTRLSHLHCCYPLRAGTLEREITTFSYLTGNDPNDIKYRIVSVYHVGPIFLSSPPKVLGTRVSNSAFNLTHANPI